MAQLSEKAVKEFQALVLKKRGIKLSYNQAAAMALDWLEFFKLVYEPIPKEANGQNKEKDLDQIPQSSKKSN